MSMDYKMCWYHYPGNLTYAIRLHSQSNIVIFKGVTISQENKKSFFSGFMNAQ
jgi:hypothetical protein